MYSNEIFKDLVFRLRIIKTHFSFFFILIIRFVFIIFNIVNNHDKIYKIIWIINWRGSNWLKLSVRDELSRIYGKLIKRIAKDKIKERKCWLETNCLKMNYLGDKLSKHKLWVENCLKINCRKQDKMWETYCVKINCGRENCLKINCSRQII